MDISICAACGEIKELCGSLRINGIQQPRICKGCLLSEMKTGKLDINDNYWMMQMVQLSDTESIKELMKENKNAG